MKTSSWTLALGAAVGHVLSRTVTSKLGPSLPVPFRLNSSRKFDFKLGTMPVSYQVQGWHNLYSLFGGGRSAPSVTLLLASNDPRCVKLRYIHEEMHGQVDDKLKCLDQLYLELSLCHCHCASTESTSRETSPMNRNMANLKLGTNLHSNHNDKQETTGHLRLRASRRLFFLQQGKISGRK